MFLAADWKVSNQSLKKNFMTEDTFYHWCLSWCLTPKVNYDEHWLHNYLELEINRRSP